VNAFRAGGGVGETFATTDRHYLEDYDIVHVNYTPGHPSYVEAIRRSLGDHSDTKLVANVDYAPSLWETINPFNMAHQLGMADTVFHVEPRGAALLGRFLGRHVHVIPHPVDTKWLNRFKRIADGIPAIMRREMVTCQWHKYNATWSAYYYALQGIDVGRYLCNYGGRVPVLVDLESLFDRVIPGMEYSQYIRDVLCKSALNIDLAPDITFGRGVVDAAALGIPTVCSNTIWAGLPELSVDPYDHQGVHDLVSKLLSDDDYWYEAAERSMIMSNQYSCINSYKRMTRAVLGV